MNDIKSPIENKIVTHKISKRVFDDFCSFYTNYLKESDRAAVILGVAKLDQLLQQLLIIVFLPNVSNQDDLLDGDAPLSTFNAKIHLAYRLGLIDSDLARALHLLRKIRNTFAHEPMSANLETGAIRDRVREFIAPFVSYEEFKDSKQSISKLAPHKKSIDFHDAFATVIIRMELAIKYAKAMDNKQAIGLIPELWKQKNKRKFPKKQYEKDKVKDYVHKIEVLQALGIQIKPSDYLNKGITLYNKKDFIGALKAWDKAIELNPLCYTAWHNKGAALSELGKYEDALIAFYKSLELNPGYAEAWNGIGLTFAKRKMFLEAIDSYNKAIQLKPDHYEALFNMACSYSNLRKKHEALKSLSLAIKYNLESKIDANKDEDFKWLWEDELFKSIVK